ncbi:SCO family protein [Blastococcus sp. SYSU D00820]
MRSSVRRLPVLLLAAGLVLGGCTADGDAGRTADAAASSSSGHDHSADGPASLDESPDDTYAGVDLPDPYQRPSFTLTDTTGAPYDFAAETAGRLTLLFFGYTSCPDICPSTMSDVRLALRRMDPQVAAQVQVVFVTTDPATDTPAVLAEYLHRFDQDTPVTFTGLTGDQGAIDRAQLSAGVPLAEDDGRLHSSLLLLYGADDLAHVAFAGNSADDIAGDLALVAAQS